MCEEEVATYGLFISSDEENAVCFVSGHVLRKIQDVLKLLDHKTVLDVLTYMYIIMLFIKSNLPVTSDTSCGRSEQWTNRIVRGGLTYMKQIKLLSVFMLLSIVSEGTLHLTRLVKWIPHFEQG